MTEEKWEQDHKDRTGANVRKIDSIYLTAITEASLIGATITNFNPDKPFSFADYPSTKYRIDKLIARMVADMQVVIVAGTKTEWAKSNFQNDLLAQSITGYNKATLEKARPKYFNNNEAARDAFINRKDSDGLNLSGRVWKYADQFKSEIEMGLDEGIRNGQPAAKMARDLRQFLQEPDRVYKRFQMNLKDSSGKPVLDSNGNTIPIKQQRRRYTDPVTGVVTWKVENPAYHPGSGVYKSSNKNAQRLTRTETNMAYRTANHIRIQQLDFVVGIHVEPSKSHKITDICDDLKGDYPKEFKYVGWHPQCICPVTNILKTIEELNADNQKILAGEPTDGQSVNQVTEVPPNFTKWVETNTKRIQNAKNVPYFITDNFVEGDPTQGLKHKGRQ